MGDLDSPINFSLTQTMFGADSNHVASHPGQLREPSGLQEGCEYAPRLVLRFALYSGAVLLAAGLAILWTINHEIASRAQRTVETQAQTVAKQNLRGRLLPSDFAAPVHGGRLAELDELFRPEVLIPGVVGTRLVNRRGTITYAARHQLIGTKVPYMRDLAAVFAGSSKRRVTRTVSWRGEKEVKVLQSLVPVRETATTKPVGALEFDQDYRGIEVGIGDASRRLGLILAIAFLVLYVSLFPILHRLTAQLASRNRRLHEQAAEREELLEAEQMARAEAEAIQRLLTEQNERLRELDGMKDEFVSLVSHELRTPLTSIRGYLELLLEEGDNLRPEQERFLGVVDRNSQRLLHLVGDLLFLAQVDAGRLAVEREEVDFEEVVKDSVEALRPIAIRLHDHHLGGRRQRHRRVFGHANDEGHRLAGGPRLAVTRLQADRVEAEPAVGGRGRSTPSPTTPSSRSRTTVSGFPGRSRADFSSDSSAARVRRTTPFRGPASASRLRRQSHSITAG